MLGLGDVYLGAPVATPLDPRHRLVTTKYNPARTWTPENAVGIGGAYLCIYGMEGPGGYQFVGRTVPGVEPPPAVPPDHGRAPVAAAVLRPDPLPPGRRRRAPRPARRHGGRAAARSGSRTRCSTWPATSRFLAANADDIAAFRTRQRAAFAEPSGPAGRPAASCAGRPSWPRRPTTAAAAAAGGPAVEAPPGAALVVAPFAAKVGDVSVAEGDDVEAGDRVAVLEAMKMEVSVPADRAGRVTWVGCRPGQLVTAGQPLVGVEPA